MIALIFSLISTLNADNSSANNPMCKEKLFTASAPPNACPGDHRMALAVRMEIAKRICLSHLDGPCLKEFSSVLSTKACTKFELDRLTGHWHQQSEWNCVMNVARRMPGTRADAIIKEWLLPNNTKLHVEPYEVKFPFAKDPAPPSSSGADLVQATLAATPTPLTQGVANLMALEKVVFTQKPTEDYEQNKECGFTSIDIGAQLTQNKTCIPSYEVQQPTIRRFLMQDESYLNNSLKCLNTCRYYFQLLGVLSSLNNFMEVSSSAWLREKPKCMPDGSVSFTYMFADPNAPANWHQEVDKFGVGQAYPLKKFTNWTGVVRESDDGLKIDLSPDQVVPDLSATKFEKLSALFERNRLSKDFPAVPKMSLQQGNINRTIPYHPSLKPEKTHSFTTDITGRMMTLPGPLLHHSANAGMLLGPSLLGCCQSPQPEKCFPPLSDTNFLGNLNAPSFDQPSTAH